MEWNDETKALTNKEQLYFTYEELVEIKDLTYDCITKVQERLTKACPILPVWDYKKLVDEYHLSVNMYNILQDTAKRYAQGDVSREMLTELEKKNPALLSGCMLNHLLEFEWNSFDMTPDIKKEILHSAIFDYPLTEQVITYLHRNIVYIDTSFSEGEGLNNI